MADRNPQTSAKTHEFGEVKENAPQTGLHLEIGDLKDVRLSLTADLGRCRMSVREVLELKQNAVIQLDKLAGEMTDIYVNGLALAKGEVVVIGDSLHVRVGEILGQNEGSEEGGGDQIIVDEDDEI